MSGRRNREGEVEEVKSKREGKVRQPCEPCETEKEEEILHICTKAYIKEVNSTHTANTHEKSTLVSISSFPPKTHTDTYNIPNQETSIFLASS